jgi:hypothetical protein
MSLLQAGLSRRSPVVLPAPPTSFCHRMQRGAPRPVAIRIRMEKPFSPLLQHSGHHRLRDTVSDGRDGRFILPFLQSRAGMFWVWWRRVLVRPAFSGPLT